MIQQRKGAYKLAAIAFGMAIVWLGVLPKLSDSPLVQYRVQKYKDAGIDPNAFFYTDHPSMRDIERRMNSVVNGENDAFWRIND